MALSFHWLAFNRDCAKDSTAPLQWLFQRDRNHLLQFVADAPLIAFQHFPSGSITRVTLDVCVTLKGLGKNYEHVYGGICNE